VGNAIRTVAGGTMALVVVLGITTAATLTLATVLVWTSRVGIRDPDVAGLQIVRSDGSRGDRLRAWSLVAAVTGRTVCAEFPDFTRTVWPDIDARVVDSIALVDSPSRQTAAKLTTASGSWVYVDNAVTDVRSWEPWARIEYDNDQAAVLRMLP